MAALKQKDAQLKRLNVTARATYDRIIALRDEIGPIGFDVAKALRELRNESETA